MLFGCGVSVHDLEAAAAAGFDYVELPCRAVSAMKEPEFRELRSRVEACPIPALAMNIYCPPEVVIAGPGFDLGVTEAYARRASSRARDLGVRMVGIGSPKSRNLPEGYDHALAMNQLSDFLAVTADAFGAADVAVCFEALGTCYCNFVQSVGQAVEIVREINRPNLAVVLDFYNMEHSGEADMELAALIPWIAHAHISDDEGDPSRRSYLLPEKAALHQSRLQRLRDCGYDGTLTLEMDVPLNEERALSSLEILRGPWG